MRKGVKEIDGSTILLDGSYNPRDDQGDLPQVAERYNPTLLQRKPPVAPTIADLETFFGKKKRRGVKRVSKNTHLKK